MVYVFAPLTHTIFYKACTFVSVKTMVYLDRLSLPQVIQLKSVCL